MLFHGILLLMLVLAQTNWTSQMTIFDKCASLCLYLCKIFIIYCLLFLIFLFLFFVNRVKGVEPDAQTYATLINACARVNNSKKAVEYFNEMIAFVFSALCNAFFLLFTIFFFFSSSGKGLNQMLFLLTAL